MKAKSKKDAKKRDRLPYSTQAALPVVPRISPPPILKFAPAAKSCFWAKTIVELVEDIINWALTAEVMISDALDFAHAVREIKWAREMVQFYTDQETDLRRVDFRPVRVDAGEYVKLEERVKTKLSIYFQTAKLRWSEAVDQYNVLLNGIRAKYPQSVQWYMLDRMVDRRRKIGEEDRNPTIIRVEG
jgi:hypothetical protein